MLGYNLTYAEEAIASPVARAAEGVRLAGWTGNMGTPADTNATTSTITMSTDDPIVANCQTMPMAISGCYQMVVPEDDGAAAAVGLNDNGQCHAEHWDLN